MKEFDQLAALLEVSVPDQPDHGSVGWWLGFHSFLCDEEQ